MIELIQVAQGIIERGMIFSFVVMGVYIASRLMRFDNLAVEGAFGLGGAITALMLSKGIHPFGAVAGAIGIGAISGVVTGLLTTQLQLNALITGIVVTTGSFSFMLKIAGSNMVIPSTAFAAPFLPTGLVPAQTMLFLFIVCAVVVYGIIWFLNTEIGLVLHAVGDNPQMVTNIGKRSDLYLAGGLALSNALAALSGSLFVLYTGYFSLWSTVGILVLGLVGMIIAQAFSNQFGFMLLVGSCLYQLIIALTFELQIDQEWNKLVTALLIVLLMFSKKWMRESEQDRSVQKL
jgi:putative tryptophan/tyrosine transport system permease protein